MAEPKRKLIDLSTSKEPADSIDPDVDSATYNPNLDPKFAQSPELSDEQTEKPVGERMIQQTFFRGGR
jgi:hypothetical protein